MSKQFFEQYNCEILAPAGSYETMLAAFNAGADAVYVGGAMFGARANATNFDDVELLNAIEYAHLCGKKLYLTVNTLLKDREINEKLYEYILPFYKAGLDAVIIQDLGVLQFVKEHFPDLPIHCSTQMTITGTEYAKSLAKLGVTRIVTPRELSLREIKDIYDATGVEIESFVHGALCYCYSGQCLLSSMIGGRSGNRGRCAQPCRLPYDIDELSIKQKYMLSPKDLCTLELLPDIIEAGVYSLKIEGRMKKPEYVASVVSVYRKYVDYLFNNGRDGYKVSKNDIDFLKEFYNRGGFTDGYYKKQNGSDLMTINRPNHYGLIVGKVISSTKDTVNIFFDTEVSKGDTIEIGNNAMEFFAPKNIKKGEKLSYKSRNIKGNLKDLEVRRTHNVELVKYISAKYIQNEKNELVTLSKEISCKLVIKMDKCIEMSVFDESLSVAVSGEMPSVAQNKPITKDDIIAKITKTGGTGFNFKSVDIELDEGIFVPIKSINELRRQAICCFKEEFNNIFRRNNEKAFDSKKFGIEDYDDIKNYNDIANYNYVEGSEELEGVTSVNTFAELHVLVNSIEQLNEILKYDNIKAIYLEYASLKKDELEKAIKLVCKKTKVILAIPYIFRNIAKKEFETDIEYIKNINCDGFLFRNLESYYFMKNNNMLKGSIIFDNTIYAFNKRDIKYLYEEGADYLTNSYELNSYELKKLSDNTMLTNVYGYYPVMQSAGCIKKTLNICNKQSEVLSLKDRAKESYKDLNVCRYCYNLLYNSRPLSLINHIDDLYEAGLTKYKINFTFENKNDVTRIMNNIIKTLKGDDNSLDFEYSKAHFNRGVE